MMASLTIVSICTVASFWCVWRLARVSWLDRFVPLLVICYLFISHIVPLALETLGVLVMPGRIGTRVPLGFYTIAFPVLAVACVATSKWQKGRIWGALAKETEKPVESRSSRAIMIAAIFGALYVAAIQSGVLRVGLGTTYVLPFHLNGILRTSALFLFPTIVYHVLLRRWGFGSCAGAAICMFFINLGTTGSKFAAAVPVIICAAVFIIYRGIGWRSWLLGGFLVSIYVMMNPYLAREALKMESGVSILEIARDTLTYNWTSGVGFAGLDGLQNMLSRMTGYVDLCNAMDIAESGVVVGWDVTGSYNDVMYTGYNQAAAPGVFGYFVILAANPVLGGGGGILFVCVLLAVGAVLARARTGSFVVVAYASALLPVIIDGNVGYSGSILDVVFTVGVALCIGRWYTVPRLDAARDRTPRSRLAIYKAMR